MLLVAAVLGACGRPEGGGRDDDVASPPEAPLASALAQAPAIEPALTAERELARATGPGDEQVVYEGVSDEFVTVYVRCLSEAPGTDLRVAVSLPDTEALEVPCDGVVFRSDILTYPGQSFDVTVGDTPGVVWTTLVTGRSRRST